MCVGVLPPHPFYKSHDFISQIVPALPVHTATQIEYNVSVCMCIYVCVRVCVCVCKARHAQVNF